MLVIVSLANVPILDPRSRTTMATLKDIVPTTFRVRVERLRMSGSKQRERVHRRIVDLAARKLAA